MVVHRRQQPKLDFAQAIKNCCLIANPALLNRAPDFLELLSDSKQVVAQIIPGVLVKVP